jgi:hypothetical protein
VRLYVEHGRDQVKAAVGATRTPARLSRQHSGPG